ncbi:metal-dependent transcriptional regulator [Salarchaeum japonicum]|uniref:Metal-dependent transcriptional regulator n=1 Tax=Salarchaeum japonicum TaxID=555573 RepID=A0AAV3SZV7_9EURY|nr:metal-dependent transcriptional regulator [Salarchaeum japonicum]
MNGDAPYLLAVYILSEQHGPPVGTSAVAELLDRSPSTVTEQFKHLDRDGLVHHEPYAGATLTEEGRERAAALHEAYVTVSWFYRSVLDLDSREADAMEVASLLSPDVADRLATMLPYDPTEGS